MSKHIFASIAAVTLAVTFLMLSSCKKDKVEGNGYNAAKLVGTWSKTFDATDYNGNNMLDATEKYPLQPGSYEYAFFNGDGTYRDSSGYSSGFTKYFGNYSVSGDYIVGFNIFGASARIVQLDDHNLIVQDTGKHPTYWTGYIK